MPTFIEIRNAIESTVRELGGLEEIRVETHNTDPGNMKFMVQCKLPGTQSVEERQFALLAPSYGLQPEDLGRVFTTRSGSYRITGINRNRPKYPISGISVHNNKQFKFAAISVITGLGRTPGPRPGTVDDLFGDDLFGDK